MSEPPFEGTVQMLEQTDRRAGIAVISDRHIV
jgi:hypothetical protein